MNPLEEQSTKPILYIFAISCYCEKARWGLDRLGIEYELRYLPPGGHMQVAKELGAPGTSVPMLRVGEHVVQGSAQILDWADSVSTSSLRLRPEPEFEADGRAIERRLDDIVGVQSRRYFYSEALIEHPETVLPIFANDLAPTERESLEASWNMICQLMTGAMDLGTEQGIESRQILEGELDWLDGLLSDGRRYLCGDRFSRVDIAAASLLALIALPKAHPTYAMVQVPPRAQVDLARWAQRPIGAWVSAIYRDERNRRVAESQAGANQ
jgi:glutathione S-transferase